MPKHLIIVGGSYIGLEFGQMYRRFGSEVTIVEMGPRLIGREDEECPTPSGKSWRRGHPDPREREVHIIGQARQANASPSNAPTERRKCWARTCCSRSAAVPTPTISASTRPG